MTHRRHLLKGAAGLAIAAALPSLGRAQSGKTVTITVGFAPGGPGEVLARRIAEVMRASLGQNVIVTNRPGAAGMLAAAAMKGMPADGTAILFSPPGIVTTQPLVNNRLPYDPNDLEPVAGLCEFAFAFAVRADHPAKNLKEFVSWAKTQPSGVNYGVLGLGNMPHFIGYRFGRDGGCTLVPIAYKGAKEVVTDLQNGSLACGLNITAGFATEHKAGSLRVLGVTGIKRTKSMADVPTFAEQGFANIVSTESFGFYGPKGVPKAEADRLYQAAANAVAAPEVVQFMGLNDFEPAPMNAEQYKAALKASLESWGPIVRSSGFRIE